MRSGADDVKTAALETLGNLAFCRDNRAAVLGAPGLRDWLARLAQDRVGLLTPAFCSRTDNICVSLCTHALPVAAADTKGSGTRLYNESVDTCNDACCITAAMSEG